MDYSTNTTTIDQQSLQGEIEELKSIVREIKSRVFEGSDQFKNPEIPTQAAHRLINIKNSIVDIREDCVDILKALTLL
jgi:hypothetical protein